MEDRTKPTDLPPDRALSLALGRADELQARIGARLRGLAEAFERSDGRDRRPVEEAEALVGALAAALDGGR